MLPLTHLSVSPIQFVKSWHSMRLYMYVILWSKCHKNTRKKTDTDSKYLHTI